MLVCQNLRNPAHKLIQQHYEPGAFGSPIDRLIEVRNEIAGFRPYQPLSPDSLGLVSLNYSAPDSIITYQGQTFKLVVNRYQ